MENPTASKSSDHSFTGSCACRHTNSSSCEFCDHNSTKSSSSFIPMLAGIKYIEFNGKSVPIFTQMTNGPCSLIAIVNALCLQRKIIPVLSEKQEIVELDSLVQLIADYIINQQVPESPELAENYQSNLDAALDVLYQLKSGIDVNVHFSGIRDFEFTKELSLLDLLNIDLYHGWVMDPDDIKKHEELSKLTYNQLMELICVWEDAKMESPEREKYMIATKFLTAFPTQLSNYGLKLLIDSIPESKVAVLFRNDHFSTIIRHERKLILLVSDHGYQTNLDVVWEIVTMAGSGNFLTSKYEKFKIIRQKNVGDSSSSISDKSREDENLPTSELDVDTAYHNFLQSFGSDEKVSEDKHDMCSIM